MGSSITSCNFTSISRPPSHARQGLPPDAARTAALRAFGGVERVREECRDARKTSWAETTTRNARYALRLLRRQPGYALAVIATLGLGIGANSAIFSVINGVLLKPLPYAESERLVLVRQSAPLAGQDRVPVSIRELYDYRDQTSDFSGLVEFHQMSFDLIRRGEPDRVTTGVVSSNFFHVLGVKPLAGRDFVAADEHHGAEAVLLLSHSVLEDAFRRRSDDRRAGVSDERPPAYRHRRPAAGAAVPAGMRRLHADDRLPVQGSGRGADGGEPSRLRGARSVWPAEARCHARTCRTAGFNSRRSVPPRAPGYL